LRATVNVAAAILLTEYSGLHCLVLLAIASLLAIVLGFVLNRSWTFRMRGSKPIPEFLRYALVTGINVPVGMVACALLTQVAGIPYAQSITMVAVTFAPLTYLIHRARTFG
jgi:putative flippase GtrA